MDLTVAIPAYNEVEDLRDVVVAAVAQIDALKIDGNVLIVDDGSRDGTAELADELAATLPRVVVRHHATNQGFGGAIRSALTTTTARFVFLAPADGQVPLDVLPAFWHLHDSADVIAGIRHQRQDGLVRRLASMGYHALSRLILGVKLTEFTSVLMFRQEILVMPMTAHPRSAALLAEIMCQAQRRGARFAEVPFRHLPRRRGRSKASLWVAAMTLLDLGRVAWSIRIAQRWAERSSRSEGGV